MDNLNRCFFKLFLFCLLDEYTRKNSDNDVLSQEMRDVAPLFESKTFKFKVG